MKLHSLVDLTQSNPALPSGHPFGSSVQSDYYWSGTSYASLTGSAWGVYLYDGSVSGGSKASTLYVWPVRGGQ